MFLNNQSNREGLFLIFLIFLIKGANANHLETFSYLNIHARTIHFDSDTKLLIFDHFDELLVSGEYLGQGLEGAVFKLSIPGVNLTPVALKVNFWVNWRREDDMNDDQWATVQEQIFQNQIAEYQALRRDFGNHAMETQAIRTRFAFFKDKIGYTLRSGGPRHLPDIVLNERTSFLQELFQTDLDKFNISLYPSMHQTRIASNLANQMNGILDIMEQLDARLHNKWCATQDSSPENLFLSVDPITLGVRLVLGDTGYRQLPDNASITNVDTFLKDISRFTNKEGARYKVQIAASRVASIDPVANKKRSRCEEHR